MDGQAVFKFAVKRVPEVIREVLEAKWHGEEDVDYYIVHQANQTDRGGGGKKAGEPIEKFPMNLQRIRQYLFRQHSDPFG